MTNLTAAFQESSLGKALALQAREPEFERQTPHGKAECAGVVETGGSRGLTLASQPT